MQIVGACLQAILTLESPASRLLQLAPNGFSGRGHKAIHFRSTHPTGSYRRVKSSFSGRRSSMV
jgi:hypothetical protein